MFAERNSSGDCA